METEYTPRRSTSQGAAASLEALPARLAQVVAYAGVSQAELARRIGASAGFVSDVLRGVKRPGVEMLMGLREAFGVSVDWLLSGEGTMIGGAGIRHDLFRAIRLQIAVARAAVMEQDATARALLLLIREGQLAAAADDQAFKVLLDRVAPEDGDLDLAVELYNGHQWATDPVSQRRNLLAAAVAHFEARKPVDRLAALTGAEAEPSLVQVNTGKGQRIAGRDFHEHGRRKR
ncbi:helix-turn-helix domain-containing protein [Xylophilus sp. ASV27]|uniref:helix-turn-helix domain-containing protein n=1 Tax=Xylophilus sp. ASV27 TaxID=2795129 RepID=UPI0018EB6C97|nr:helix-turn-helix transcriptional regulator [Xylophilus sp. ASV27]